MKIAYNPKEAGVLTKAPANFKDDIVFDLAGKKIFAKDVEFKGTDTVYSVFKKDTSEGIGGYNGLVPKPNYNSNSKTRYLREDGIWVIPTNTNDKVLQSRSTTANFRPIILGHDNDTNKDNILDNQTAQVYTAANIYAQPSTGNLYANKFIGHTNWDTIDSKPTSFTPSTHYHDIYVEKHVCVDDTDLNDYKLTGFYYGYSMKNSAILGKCISTFINMYYSPDWGTQVQFCVGGGTYIRYWKNAGGIFDTTWKQFAYTTDNVASATKLYTARKINGVLFDGTKDITITANPNSHEHNTSQINALTDYTIATKREDLKTTDTLNIALGKLEYKSNLGCSAYDIVKAAYDGDGTIENLQEILKVLDGIKDTDTIKNLLNKYLPLTGGALTGNLTAKEFHLSTYDNNDAVLLAGGSYKLENQLRVSHATSTDKLLNIRISSGDLDTFVGDSLCTKIYFAAGDNTVTNKPEGVECFGLIPLHAADAYTALLLVGLEPSTSLYLRSLVNSHTSWKKLAFISDNVASATKLLTARTINGVSFDGTKNITITADPNAHTHNSLGITDNRGEERLPEYYPDKTLSTFFNECITNHTGWKSGITVKGWHAGYATWLLFGGSGTTSNEWYLRAGMDTAWQPAVKIWHSGNAVTRYLNINGENKAFLSEVQGTASTFYAPITNGTKGLILQAEGNNKAPIWVNQESVGMVETAKSLNVTANWMNTGIDNTILTETGTYIILVTVSANDGTGVMWNCIFSGIMSWYSTRTNDTETDEIILHRSGHAYDNTIYLRTSMNELGILKLQIAANRDIGKAYNYIFKFKKIM